jgi:hypothetical protein
MTSSLAVLADTFGMVGSWSPGIGSPGSAAWISAASLTDEAVCMAAPPAATETLRTAAPIAAKTGLCKPGMILLFRQGEVGCSAAPRERTLLEVDPGLVAF